MAQRALIVGGGLVGSLLAVALARLGFEVDVYERSPDPRASQNQDVNSINLTLCERGLFALDRFDLGPRVREVALPAYGRIIHALDGGTSFQPYGPFREAIHSISRSRLNRLLVEHACQQRGVRFHFDRRCSEIDPSAPALRLDDADDESGGWISGDILFASDGASSTTRRRLERTTRLHCSQYYVPQAYVELAVPARGADWPLDATAIHVWPRGPLMLIGFANLDRSFTLALHMPVEGERSFASIQTPAELEGMFAELFADAMPMIPALAEQFFRFPGRSMVTIRCDPWVFEDKVALIGDSAHAIVPSYGQGANCGFEDVSVLFDCIVSAEGNLPVALAEWQRQRKPDADVIADLALEHFTELQSQLADPDFLERKAVERRLTELYPDSFQPLYSLISFTCVSYREARSRDHGQKRLVDAILRDVRGAGEPDAEALDSAIHQHVTREWLRLSTKSSENVHADRGRATG
ncbi:MAG TPA: NAD(P)/FAD-dependent oxidoreductase [Thermoanaerobaculia bacterium]|nr:NAD(P)/FAD-dependent oxidoreductase [Thermoanaerobaculia bacterium]